jgi:hypothetical protein
MRFLKSNPIFNLLNSYLIDSPQPANISYMWNFGSLLGICLLIQILTGVFLAMHYTPNVDLAFISVEHIMRDVNSGWFLRYTHANVASFFFLFLYFHTARGLYYSSYKTPRVLLWSIGVIILILTMAIAFLGYVLPYGQMSLWGINTPIFIYSIVPVSVKNKPNKSFMGMFVGFMDGDGYFDIGSQKQYNKLTKALVKSTIRIRLATNVHIRDLPLLEYFVRILGTGKISKMSGDREQVRVIFSKRDFIQILLPLIKEYNLKFLTYQRVKQFALVNYILKNNIIHWDNVKFIESEFKSIPDHDLVKLDFFGDWLIGFTIAEGSFGMKSKGSAFYQLKQKGVENLPLLKAACLRITDREARPMKADSVDAYQLCLSSKNDIDKVISFFSSSDHHPLFGYKSSQFTLWLKALRMSARYSNEKQGFKLKNFTYNE